MKPEAIHLFSLVSLRALADYDPVEYRRVTDLSKSEIDTKIKIYTSYIREQEDIATLTEVEWRLEELRNIEDRVESLVTASFLLKDLVVTSLNRAQQLAVTDSPEHKPTSRERSTSSVDAEWRTDETTPSREEEYVRLAVMRLLRELPNYYPNFAYELRGGRVDCLLQPNDGSLPVILVEAKAILRTADQARHALRDLKKVAAGWGKSAITIVIVGTVDLHIRGQWQVLARKTHLLLFDAEANEFKGDSLGILLSAIYSN